MKKNENNSREESNSLLVKQVDGVKKKVDKPKMGYLETEAQRSL